LTVSEPHEVLVIALQLDDPILAGRLAGMLASVPTEALTNREQEVLALLAEGASNKTIARRLGFSVHTAKFHVGQLLDKLDATGRTDAVAHALRPGRWATPPNQCPIHPT
jgi:DNA-binding CsgD family transcriptional regulator